jgi:hypothetical protein
MNHIDKKILEKENELKYLKLCKDKNLDKNDILFKNLIERNNYCLLDYVDIGINNGIPIFVVDFPAFQIDIKTLLPSNYPNISNGYIKDDKIYTTIHTLYISNYQYNGCFDSDKVKEYVEKLFNEIFDESNKILAFYLYDIFLNPETFNLTIRLEYLTKKEYKNIIKKIG